MHFVAKTETQATPLTIYNMNSAMMYRQYYYQKQIQLKVQLKTTQKVEAEEGIESQGLVSCKHVYHQTSSNQTGTVHYEQDNKATDSIKFFCLHIRKRSIEKNQMNSFLSILTIVQQTKV